MTLISAVIQTAGGLGGAVSPPGKFLSFVASEMLVECISEVKILSKRAISRRFPRTISRKWPKTN